MHGACRAVDSLPTRSTSTDHWCGRILFGSSGQNRRSGTFAETDPISAKVAAARVKQYLPDPLHAIRLHDLLTSETERTKQRTGNAFFPTAESNPTNVTTLARLKRYDSELDVLVSMLACVAYFGKPEVDELVLGCFKRLADESGPEPGIPVWLEMKRYPALRALYAIGIAGVAAGNYRLLKRLFELKIRKRGNGDDREYAAVTRIHDHAVINRQHQPLLLGRQEHTPLSNYLFEGLQDAMRHYLPEDGDYEDAFIWFEYLRCLCSLDAKLSSSEAEALAASDKSELRQFWIPVGRFGWRPNRLVNETTISGDPYPEKVAAVLRHGLFESGGKLPAKKFISIKALADRFTERVRNEWGVWW